MIRHSIRKPPPRRSGIVLALLSVVVAGTACRSETTTDPTPTDEAEFNRDRPGGALPFLTSQQRNLFLVGSGVFQAVFTPETGLGPLFNSNSCATCHAAPVVGGFGVQIETHATKFVGGTCDDLEEINGGSVVQDSATPLLRAAGYDREPMPAEATGSGRRTTPDLLGFGMLEAIPAATIMALADPNDRNHDGISGRPNLSEDGELGRFGRKAQAGTLEDFVTDAFIYEQGITSLDEPEEQTLVGTPLPPGVDPTPDPEISEDALHATIAFIQFLAPPQPLRMDLRAEQGRRIFAEIGCASCHVPAMRTGRNPVRALSRQVVRAYSDLLLHDMGPALADICKSQALPSEFRTEPLMGIRFSSLFLHDGRATTIEQAVVLHGGEAQRARDRFQRLSPGKRAAVLSFLSKL